MCTEVVKLLSLQLKVCSTILSMKKDRCSLEDYIEVAIMLQDNTSDHYCIFPFWGRGGGIYVFAFGLKLIFSLIPHEIGLCWE